MMSLKRMMVVAAALVFAAGCKGPTELATHVIDRIADSKTIDSMVSQAKATTWQVNGGLAGQNPKLVLSFEGEAYSGVRGKLELGFDGVFGQATAASQGARDPEPRPGSTP